MRGTRLTATILLSMSAAAGILNANVASAALLGASAALAVRAWARPRKGTR